MKKLLLILIALPLIGVGQNVNIPDANFKAYLVGNTAINTNGDTEIQVSEATVFNGSISCSNMNIADLTGIEAFTALTQLYCANNQLTSLDVSNNTNLLRLKCNHNQLTSLNVSQNTALTNFVCSYNQLTSLDVSNNTALPSLFCENNQLTSLDVSSNTAITYLSCHSNQLTSLDVRNGNNTNFTAFTCTNNPNLLCIDVDNAAYSTANWTNIDPWASFSTNCATAFGCTDSLASNYDPLATIDDSSCIYMTYVPDDNFEQILIAYGYDNVLDDYVATANIDTLTWIYLSSDSISDLTGIEDFTALTTLHCSNNQLTTLDVSNNTALTTLQCAVNQLTTLDVSNNTALTILGSSSNQLTSLDVSNNPALITLGCSENQLTSLDVSANTALAYLSCGSNQLTSLDLSTNTALISLVTQTNQLTSLDVSNNTALTDLDCRNNQLTILDVSNNTALTDLDCASNQLTSLDVSNNPALINLFCSYNQLTSLDVSANTALTTLYSKNNQLTSLDVSTNTALIYLVTQTNQLTSLDVSNNLTLTCLTCSNNQLTSLDVRNGNNTNVYNFKTLNNPNLTCISVDDPVYSTSNWTTIDPASSFGINCSNEPNFTYVPDDNFEQALIDLGYDTYLDDYVLTANINTVTSLNVYYSYIADLTGIEDFTALTTLKCFGNQLTSLDVSNNTALTTLQCSYNQLTSLDVSANTALTLLYCYDNQLTSLDVSTNTALTFLRCENNQLTSLDVSANTALTLLYCNSNQLTSLDVRNGNNLNMYNPNFMGNYNLYCIDVDSAAYSTANWYNFGPWAIFSNDCQLGVPGCIEPTSSNYDPNATVNNGSCIYAKTYVPDDNFEARLEEDGMGDGIANNDSVWTIAIASRNFLYVDYDSIADLTGIEDFIALEVLGCSNNQLTSLNLSSNTALTELYCPNNQLTFINLSGLALSNQMMWFDALYNPLVCVLVQNTAYFNINFINDIPPSASFNQPVSNISTVVSCSSYQWAANGQTYNSSGTHTEEILSVNGCLNTEVLNLTITQPTTSSVSVTECDGYTWNGINYTSSGIYTWTGTNTAGCDSTATLNLSIIQSNTGSSLITTCDSYTWDGSTYSTTGVYANSYNNMAGCDSVHTLFLVITDSTSNTISETICDDPYYWFLNGQTYDSSGVYTETSTNSNGCTHTETLDLTINYSTSSTDTHFACDEFMWYCDGNLYTSSNNTATYVYTNAVGCDSIVTLDLTINSVIASIDQEGDNLSAVTTPVGLNANWYNIQTDNGETRIWLMEEDTSSFSPTFECSYFIIVNDAGCVDTSETYYYGANAARIGSFITSPNPTTGLINVKFDNPKNQFVMLELISNNGSKLDEFITVDNNLNIDLSKYPSGSYYLYFNSEDAVQGCRLEEVQKISAKIILNK